MRFDFKIVVPVLIAATAVALVLVYTQAHQPIPASSSSTTAAESESDELNIPPSVPLSAADIANQPSDASALGGLNVLIADRGNNRLIEVTPEKQIVWEYDFHLPELGLGADDAFFANNGKTIIVNLEEYHQIELIDYQSKQVIWTYGKPGIPGSADGYLHTPDDAYFLPNGDITVADIKNCRVIEIGPDQKIVRQYGKTGACDNKPGDLYQPNGDTPLPNGGMFISNIVPHTLVELDKDWQAISNITFPISYPSDPQPMKDGNILVADYLKHGKIIEMDHQGNIVWSFTGDPALRLNRPSLAIELPNGNILANDDYNHRVIVINKQTNQIVWQYGINDKPGDGPNQLNVPDGLDVIDPTAHAVELPLHKVGEVTWHATDFVNRPVRLQGYLLKRMPNYIIFSDEPTGSVSAHDLVVTGDGIDTLKPSQKYELEGNFLYGALTNDKTAIPYHLELIDQPK